MIKNFIKGLVFGASVGSIGGLFWAPRSGKETQQLMKDYVDEVSDSLDDATDSAKELQQSVTNFGKEMNHTQKTIQETIPSVMDSLQKDVEAFKFQAQPRIDRANEQAQELQTHIADFSVNTSESTTED
ncbi:YtxH domain-containing protein [Tetragenococcus koreensis]|uniref:YtxH domain-containing protein n=1 Tax=Tetragenococcus koreensis TaxID=290335 RepID=A0AAN4RL94_9ENTE|nr:YtxH domain-containing protein [Tetragenococcus koreensis]AYW46210.1 hypothetical protein C7K43_09900 [Tetragenococcus koreensis]MCF1584951.1 YtxH domain-containing protein [Tetragenococcus koreensis]MCF1614464.1 YtxH domain-containing protein [Tetragenococcus koreensis]MCF1617225.1 YtxH domain-containing protein [Tetragenococcus koreensis]MCF1619867.1 YtxH domain-containing protein [Tetragenococcus koreensis]